MSDRRSRTSDLHLTVSRKAGTPTTEPNHRCHFIAQPPIPAYANELYGLSHLHVADFDGDRLLDVLHHLQSVPSIQLFLGYKNNSFETHQEYVYRELEDEDDEVSTHTLFVVDLNHDHHLDLVFIYDWPVRVSVAYGYGNGSFQHPDSISNPDLSHADLLLFEDLNNDTYVDLVVRFEEESKIVVYLGRQDHLFPSIRGHEMNISAYFWHMALADFNADGILDLVYGTYDGHFIIHLGVGDGSFHLKQSHPTTLGGPLVGAMPCDVNGDGRVDVIFLDYRETNFVVMLNDGNGTFRNVAFDYMNAIDRSHIQIGDMNHDTHLDIVLISDFDASKIEVYYGFGNGSFAALEGIFAVEDRVLEQLELADFNGE